MKFRTAVFLPMGLLIVLVVAVASLATTLILDGAAGREGAAGLVRAQDALAGALDQRRALKEAEIRQIARAIPLEEALKAEHVDDAVVRSVAATLARKLASDRVIVVDRSGRLLADIGRPAWATGDPAADPLLAGAIAGRAGAATWSGDSAALLVIAQPITAAGVVHGAIAAGYAIDDGLAGALARQIGAGVVLSAAGKPIAHSSFTKAARPHEDELAQVKDGAPRQVELAGKVIMAVAAPFSGDLRATLIHSLEPARAARQRVLLVLLLVGVAALLLSLLAAAATGRLLSLPIDALVAFTRRVADGRLEERVSAAGVIEVKALGESMNEMIAKLDESHGRLVLADRLASVGTLAAGVEHEINNPLTYVTGNLEMLDLDLQALQEELPEGRLTEAHEMMKDTRDGVDRVRRIVRDLKVFSRAGEDERATVNLSRVIDLSVNMTRHEVCHRARLVRDNCSVPPVLASEGRLAQVLVNLIVNAAHSIPEGNIEGNEIPIVTRWNDDGRVRVEVRDTGSGMPPEIRRRIFNPFFTTKEVGLGTGLGLSICHAIVAGLGGEITVESQPGKGTVFTILLRVADEEKAVARAAAAARDAGGRRGRVLFVDDEPMLGSMVKRALGSEHDITAVTDGRLALDALSGDPLGRYDVVLCDLMMPRMTGMDLYAELARRAPNFLERIIFITGGAFTPQARKFIAEVPNRCIEKPIDMVALRAVIRERLRQQPA